MCAISRRAITTMRMTIIVTVSVAAALLLAGCGSSSAIPRPDVSGLAALDAQATLAVWSAQEAAAASATRQAAESQAQAAQAAAAGTAAAVDAANATVAANATGVALDTARMSAEATATWDALAARQMAMGIEATATADAAALAFQEATAAKALAARQAEIDRDVMWNRMLPWLVGAAVVFVSAVVVGVVGVWALPRIWRARPQQAGDTWIMVDANGAPMVLNRPLRALPTVSGPTPLALPAGTPAEPVPLPPARRGHVLIAGETGSGKSSAMVEVLRARAGAVVLDPHWNGRDWGGARVIGGGRDFDAIREYMDEMRRMLKERYEAREGGRTEFAPLTVAVDEMPAIVGALGRDIEATWREWLREGRKVGLFLALATQSTRVRTLGIEGERDLLENFTYVLMLGNVARREYGALVNGMARPAVLVTKGAARPVVIPHVEAAAGPTAAPVREVAREVPAGDLDGDGGGDVILLPGPMFTAPAPVYEPDPDNMTDADRARVVAEYRATRSMAAVQRAIFPSYNGSGGRAFYAIKDVLVAAGEMPPYREAAMRPTPGYLYG